VVSSTLVTLLLTALLRVLLKLQGYVLINFILFINIILSKLNISNHHFFQIGAVQAVSREAYFTAIEGLFTFIIIQIIFVKLLLYFDLC
jgi:hypothetical protein